MKLRASSAAAAASHFVFRPIGADLISPTDDLVEPQGVRTRVSSAMVLRGEIFHAFRNTNCRCTGRCCPDAWIVCTCARRFTHGQNRPGQGPRQDHQRRQGARFSRPALRRAAGRRSALESRPSRRRNGRARATPPATARAACRATSIPTWSSRTAANSEDCLYLNVFTPADSSGHSKLPVMFWIHGGGYKGGSASEPRHNGDFLPLKGVVLVTINYRLGVFGFLATADLPKKPAARQGTTACMDMVAALQWVQGQHRKVRRRSRQRHHLRRERRLLRRKHAHGRRPGAWAL